MKWKLEFKRRHSLATAAVEVAAAVVMVVVVSVVAVEMQTYFQLLSHQLLYTPGRYLLCVLRPCQRLCRLFLLFLLFVGLGAATPAPRWGVAEPKLVCQLCIAFVPLPSLLTSETVQSKLYYMEPGQEIEVCIQQVIITPINKKYFFFGIILYLDLVQRLVLKRKLK
jgi:hypothetical protein